jgi:hypothetical protein
VRSLPWVVIVDPPTPELLALGPASDQPSPSQ